MTDTSSPHPHLRLDRQGPVLTVTLCRPEQRNAQVPSLWRALGDVAESLDPSVRVVVLAGVGASFSAGLDRSMLSAEPPEGEPDVPRLAADGTDAAERAIAGFQRGFAGWGQADAIVVASVQGHAIGAGFQLALAADLRVVADDVQFAMRETSLGLVPDLGGTLPLVRAVGYARALEICATGRFVGAAEAVSIGLASMTVPVDRLPAATAQAVEALVAAPEAALRELKPLLRSAVTAAAAEQLQAEQAAQARLLAGMLPS